MGGRTLNRKIVLLSIMALAFLGLTYFASWWFILPVAIILWINQREVMGKLGK